jgi:hypothetical protein
MEEHSMTNRRSPFRLSAIFFAGLVFGFWIMGAWQHVPADWGRHQKQATDNEGKYYQGLMPPAECSKAQAPILARARGWPGTA